jgi:hypothetical protein
MKNYGSNLDLADISKIIIDFKRADVLYLRIVVAYGGYGNRVNLLKFAKNRAEGLNGHQQKTGGLSSYAHV